MRLRRPPTPDSSLGSLLALALVLTLLLVGGFLLFRTLWWGQSPIALWGAREGAATAEIALMPATLTPIATPQPPAGTPALMAPSATAMETMPEPTVRPATPSPALAAGGAAEPGLTGTPPIPPTEPGPLAATFYPSAAGPDFARGCDSAHLFGYVRDAAGQPLIGQAVSAWSASQSLGLRFTSNDPPGWYDFALPSEPMSYSVQVVDERYLPLSPAVEVYHSGQFIDGVEGCWHQVDWQQAP